MMSRRGENIYKRKDGRWEGRIRSSAPEKKRISVYGRSYQEVKEKMQRQRACPRTDLPLETVGNAIFRWLAFKENTLKASSVAKYRNLSQKHIVPLLGGKKIPSLQRDTLAEFVRRVSTGETNHGAPLSAKSVRDILMILKDAVRFVGGTRLPGVEGQVLPRAETKKKIRVFSVAEQQKIETLLLSDPDGKKIGLLLGLYAGLRIGEICALRWENIDLREGTISVTRTLQRLQLPSPEGGRRTAVIESAPKSAESNRMIPIADFLIPYLKKLKPKCETHYFLSGEEKCIEPRCYENFYKKTLSLCGVPYCNFHVLRHTFATRCIESDVDIKALSEMLGHSTVKLTLDRYVHPTMATKQKSILRLSLSRRDMWSDSDFRKAER